MLREIVENLNEDTDLEYNKAAKWHDDKPESEIDPDQSITLKIDTDEFKGILVLDNFENGWINSVTFDIVKGIKKPFRFVSFDYKNNIIKINDGKQKGKEIIIDDEKTIKELKQLIKKEFDFNIK